MLEEQIKAIYTYFNRYSEDSAYVQEIVDRFGCDHLFDTACQLLGEQTLAGPHAASCFLRDISGGLLGNEIRSSFQHLLTSERLLTTLVDGLDQSNFHVRRNACYTLGKLYLTSAVPAMIACFNRRVHDDPLFLDSLLFEIHWLEEDDKAHALRFQTVLQSPEPLVRWSAILRLKNMEDDIAHLHRLVSDGFSPLANEARYRLNSLETEPAGTPPLTFDKVATSFWMNREETTYSLDELREFVENSQASSRSTMTDKRTRL